jgi:hypothetical protein
MGIESELDTAGYVVLEDVVSDELVERGIERLESIRSAGRDQEMIMPLTGPHSDYLEPDLDEGRIYDLFQQYPVFSSMVRNEKVLDVAENVIGPGILLYKNAVWYRPQEAIGFDNIDPKHRDASDYLLVWISLFEDSERHEPLEIRPGSHVDEDGSDGGKSAVAPTLSAGDAVLCLPRVYHAFLPDYRPESPEYVYRITLRTVDWGISRSGRDGPLAIRPPERGTNPDRAHGTSSTVERLTTHINRIRKLF